MKARDIYDSKPFGATVHFSDGTTRPSDRHNKKLAAWRRTNGSGKFAGISPPVSCIPGSPGGIKLKLLDSDVISYTMNFSNNSNLEFTVEPPAPGTVMSYREFGGEIEVAHVWPDLSAAEEWARRNHYSLYGHGAELWAVLPNGELMPLTAPIPATI